MSDLDETGERYVIYEGWQAVKMVLLALKMNPLEWTYNPERPYFAQEYINGLYEDE